MELTPPSGSVSPLTQTGDFTHPIKEDVKKKIFLLSPRGRHRRLASIQPRLLIRGAFDFSALARRACQRRGQPQLLVPTHWFHKTVVLDARRFRGYASYVLA